MTAGDKVKRQTNFSLNGSDVNEFPKVTRMPTDLPAPPYPEDTKANGWKPEFDIQRIKQSKTWVLADPEVKPFLLRLWIEAWEQLPCGAFEDDDELIAANIGASLEWFQAHKNQLLRDWVKHSDGLLYHPYITEQILGMLSKRRSNNYRQENFRRQAAEIKALDGHSCVYCGATTYLTIDHVMPVSRGGGNEKSNLVCSCRTCNSTKKDKTPDEAGMVFLNKTAELRVSEGVGNALSKVCHAAEQEQEQEQELVKKKRQKKEKPKKNTRKTPKELLASANVNPGCSQDILEDWISYKQEISTKPYKSPRGVTAASNMLARASPENQRLMVDQAISGDWQGLHLPRSNNNAPNSPSASERARRTASEHFGGAEVHPAPIRGKESRLRGSVHIDGGDPGGDQGMGTVVDGVFRREG